MSRYKFYVLFLFRNQKEQLNYEREKLMKKLIEAELDGQAASHQVNDLTEAELFETELDRQVPNSYPVVFIKAEFDLEKIDSDSLI